MSIAPPGDLSRRRGKVEGQEQRGNALVVDAALAIANHVPVDAKLLGDMISGGLGMAIALVVVAPLTEELLFRGLILRGFMQRYGTVPAVLLSTLLFALVHVNPYQFASAITMGVFLAWLFVRTRSLWPCIIAHALFNCHLIVLPILRDTFGLQIRGYTGMPGDGPVVFQPLWFDALGLVLVGLGVWTAALLAGPYRSR